MTAQRVLHQAPGHHAGPFDAEFLGGATSRSMRCRTSASSGVPRGRSAHGGLAGAINGRCSGPSDRPVSGTTGRYKSYRARCLPTRTAQVARQAGSTGQMHPGSPGHETTICRGARLSVLALTRMGSPDDALRTVGSRTSANCARAVARPSEGHRSLKLRPCSDLR